MNLTRKRAPEDGYGFGLRVAWPAIKTASDPASESARCPKSRQTFSRHLPARGAERLLHPARLMSLCVVIACAIFSGKAGEPQPHPPDLIGVVSDDRGDTLFEATVFIYTAGPRVGTSTLCPSCYLDCRKRATTDKDGTFRIPALDPSLLFRLLVVGKNHKSKFVNKVDPLAGPVNVALERLEREKYGPKQTLSGRVVNSDGEPVFGAVVNFDIFFGEEANCGGDCAGVDQAAVSDHDGRFLITSEKKFDWMTVTAEAPGLARRRFFKLDSSQTHELRLTEGATVTGRLQKAGQLLKGFSVGLVSVDRSDDSTGGFEATTNDEGFFCFQNIPPYHEYFVYGLMRSLQQVGCVAAKRLRVAADGSSKSAGDLEVTPGVRLTGRVVLADGNPVPPHTRLSVGPANAWDALSVELDPNGRFEAPSLPRDSYGVSVHVRGYSMSLKNKSLDRINGGLVGRIDQDTDLTILLEPGQFAPPDFQKPWNLRLEAPPRDKPLQGADAVTAL